MAKKVYSPGMILPNFFALTMTHKRASFLILFTTTNTTAIVCYETNSDVFWWKEQATEIPASVFAIK
jgi:hypothetical protein